MRFSPEQLAGLPESSDRRARARRTPSALTSLDLGEGNGGIVLNVSETGLAIAVAQAMTDEQVVGMSFKLPQLDRTFQAEGEIVWRSESKKSAGVRFVNLEERDRVQIRNWIRAEIVGAELQIPPREVAGPAALKPVLMMPSPRTAVRQAERDAERDEARSAEFDRMFPSEASLKAVEAPTEPEFNLLAATTEDEDVELAAEAFLATQTADDADPEVREAEPEAVEAAAFGPQNIEPAEHESEAEAAWREEWARQFRLGRESLERSRAVETILELPAPFSAPLPETSPVSSHIPTRSDEVSAESWTKKSAVGAAVLTRGESSPLMNGGKIAATPAAVVAEERKDGKNPLSIAALCGVLVVMCFILGYAIQPGSFRSWMPGSADAPDEAATPKLGGQAEEETSPAPTPAITAPVTSPARENDATNSAADTGAPVSVQKEKSIAAVPKISQPADKPKITQQPPAAFSAVQPSATTATAAPVQNDSRPQALTPAPAQAAALSPNGPVVASAPAAAPAPAAAIPVSFFPVTAPSAGSPAKLMQLPEETILETSAIVIRSHQFLFVPAQAGLESEHPLERVHLGDRILKVNPTYPAQALEKFQGGTVHLRSTIGPDGTVLDVQTISGPTSLIPAAASAVRQWRYKPTDIDGKPIAIEEDILVEFRPSRETATK
jgi:TonB family protein